MVHKSTQSPSKGTSSSSHPGMQVSWSEANTDILLDLVATHRASAGDGLNFKTSFWNTVAAALCNPSKGAVKSSKACKDKWKRLRKTYEAVECLCNKSGFAYSLELGANIGPESESIWTEFIKHNKDASPFKIQGWPHFEKMKQFMPSNGKGLHRFSALTIGKSSSLGEPSVGTPTSGSDSGGGSIGTVGAPSTAHDATFHPVQGATEGGSVRGANIGFTGIDTDVMMASTPQPLQLSANQVAHFSFAPPSSSTGNPIIRSIARPYPASSVGPHSTTSGHTNMTFDWHSDLSVPRTPTSFTPPTAPSSFNGSSISSVKPSSSISARMERTEQSRKRKVDDDERSIISSTMSAALSTSSAQKRHVGKAALSREQLGEKFEKLENMYSSISDQSGLIQDAVSALGAKAIEAKVSTSTTHPIVHAARKKLVEMDASVIPPSDVVLLFKRFHDNHDFADGYLQLTAEPGLVAARQAWLKDGIEAARRSA